MLSGWSIVHYGGFNKPIDDYFFYLINKYRHNQSAKSAREFLKDWAPAEAFKIASREIEAGIRDFGRLPPLVDAKGVPDLNFKVLKIRDWIGYYEIFYLGAAAGILSCRIQQAGGSTPAPSHP